MKKEYIEHYSKCLNKQMHLCIYGHAGVTVLGFPTQDSNCHNYEDFGIIYHLSDFIEQGRIQIVTVDSVDKESWSCENGILSWRSARQEQYHNYIIEEVYDSDAKKHIKYAANCNRPKSWRKSCSNYISSKTRIV